jgi:phosphoribosylformylglycinamidine cyclo-ligase
VADAMLKLTGRSFYANIGIDTVATIVNDLITTGALPISVAMHAAVGDSSWFASAQRAEDLARGFRRRMQAERRRLGRRGRRPR